MTPSDFRRIVMEELGYSLNGFSRRMGLSERFVRRLATGEAEIPLSLQMTLRGEKLEPATGEYRDRRRKP